MIIEINNEKYNLKKIASWELERIILYVIETNNKHKHDIIDFAFKKTKIKPHKKIFDKMSFI